jgi:hypothetical protein
MKAVVAPTSASIASGAFPGIPMFIDLSNLANVHEKAVAPPVVSEFVQRRKDLVLRCLWFTWGPFAETSIDYIQELHSSLS